MYICINIYKYIYIHIYIYIYIYRQIDRRREKKRERERDCLNAQTGVKAIRGEFGFRYGSSVPTLDSSTSTWVRQLEPLTT